MIWGWMPAVLACDGAQSFGYGGCLCRLDPGIAREAVAATSCGMASLVPHDVTTECSDDPKHHYSYVLPCNMEDFTTIFSVRSDASHHSTKLEMGAAALTLRSLIRRRAWNGKRVLMMTDSTAVLFVMRKGRSFAGNMRRGMRQGAASIIAANLMLHMAYVPSRWNPADRASRGLARHRTRDPPPAKEPASMRYFKQVSRGVRRLQSAGWLTSAGLSSRWGSSCSSSCMGQPSIY